MRRTAVASVAGLAVVGTLVVPAILPMATLPTASAALAPPPAVPPRILFSGVTSAGSPDSAADLYDIVAEDATDQRQRLESSADGSYGFHSPSYAPDGARAVFTREIDDDEGEGSQLVTADLSAGLLATAIPLESAWTTGTWDEDPDWSADGRIVFTRAGVDPTTGEDYGRQLRIVAEAGGTPVDPLAALGPVYQEIFDGAAVAAPAWSPDGTRIAFTTADEGPYGDLWILDLEDTTLAPVVRASGDQIQAQGPAWSPDGELAFADGLTGVLRRGTPQDATDERVLLDSVAVYTPLANDPRIGLFGPTDPAWSPDGSEITVVGTNYGAGEPAYGLFTITVADGAVRALSLADPFGFPWLEVGATDYQPVSDLAVTLAASATEDIEPGELVTLTATVTNSGPSPAWGAQVLVELPGAVNGVSLVVGAPPGCEGDGGYRFCELPEPLPPGESAELTFTVVLEEPASYRADVRVTSSTPDPLPEDNVATVGLEVPLPVAEGIEPRLAFSYVHGFKDAGVDVADVLAADASDFRMLVEESVAFDGRSYQTWDETPSYSPDGRRIVFTTDGRVAGSNGEAELVSARALMTADVGPGPGRATDVQLLDYERGDLDDDFEPVWSPAGDRIAFLRISSGDGNPQLAVVPTDTAEAPVTIVVPEEWPEGTEVEHLAWAPDGERLVVAVHGPGTEGDPALWVIHLDDEVAYRVVQEVPDCGTLPSCLDPVVGAAPAWSPDGTTLALVQGYSAGQWFVHGLATAAIGTPTMTPTGESAYVVPAPVLVAGVDPGYDGEDPPEGYLHLSDPTWALDSASITAVGSEGDGRGVLLSVPADGGATSVLREDFPGIAAGVADPVYQPWADVAVDLSASPSVDAGRPTTLTATVTNLGPSPAWETVAELQIPALATGDATLESWPMQCTPSDTGLSCALPSGFAADTPVTLEITVRLTAPGEHAVRAVATTGSIDPEPGNDATVLTLVSLEPPAVEVQPQLAFTRQTSDWTADSTRDVADVPQAGGPYDLARLLAHQTVTTPAGQTFHLDEEHPDYSPDGTTLVFSANAVLDGGGEQYLSSDQRLTVGTLVRDEVPVGQPALTDIHPLEYSAVDGFSDLEPVWSPDGETIAFTRQDTFYGMDPAVHLLDVATGQVRELVLPEDIGFEASAPAWAPDGQRLAVQVTANNEGTEVWIVHLDPTGDTWFPVGSLNPDCSGSPLDCFEAWVGRAPAWSPDGTQLAVGDAEVYSSGPDGYSAISVWDLPAAPGPGGYEVLDERLLVGTPTSHDGDLDPGQLEAAWHPAWSPGGTEISFVGRPQGQSYDTIYRIPSTGSIVPIVRLAEWTENNPGRYADPTYQPWADVSLELSGPSQVDVGDDLQVRALVANAGPSDAWGLEVTIQLPAAATVTAAVPGCGPVTAGTITCTAPGPLTPGASTAFTIPVRLATPGTHAFAGELTTRSFDTDEADNIAEVTVEALTSLPSADGVEPRLAFTYVPDVQQELPPDVADVYWADGEQFRVIADARDADAAGTSQRLAETDPSYSPDGRQLVYSAALTDGDGASDVGARLMVGQTRPGLTGLVDVAPLDYDRPAGADDVDPAWSPEGTRIAFVRRLPSAVTDELVLVDLATGAVHEVPGMPDFIQNPSWSPDGERIVVDATFGQGSLWVVHVDADEAFPVAFDQPACDPEVSDCTFTTHAPSWSPDGTRVAFIDRYPTADGYYVDGLFTVTMPAAPVVGTYQAGTAQRLVGPDPVQAGLPGDAAYLDGPAWSLDGTSLAFVGQAWSEESPADVIYTVPATGGPFQVLRDDVREGVVHGFGDLVYQPWADVGVTVTTAPPEVQAGEPVDVTVTVANHGPSPAWEVAVDVDLPATADLVGALPPGCADGGSQVTCSGPDAMPVGATQVFTFTLTAPEPGSHETSAAVTSRMIDPVSGNDVASAAFDSVPEPPPLVDLLADVAVTLELSQPTGWVGGDPVGASVVVTNTGAGSAGAVVLTMTYPDLVEVPAAGACLAGDPCELGTLAAGASRTIAVDLTPVEAGTADVAATVVTSSTEVDPGDNSATATLEVLQPTLRLLPTVTTPGEATLAYGVDFPPGAQLTLSWSRGITPWLRPVTVREDGTVRSPLLILPGDELGQRIATATSAEGAGFGDVEAPPMLVVPRNFSPPNFLTRG